MSSSLDMMAQSASMDLLDEGNERSQDHDSEEEEELTAAEVLKRLQTAWRNEHGAPCLLEPQKEVVDCMFEQIAQLEANLRQVGKQDLRVPSHKMELDRIRFMISDYLRIRLKKIERFVLTLPLNDSRAIDQLLTREEAEYARNFKAGLTAHFSELALSQMPGDFGSIDPKKSDPKLPEPNLDSAVFVRVERTVRGVLLVDETNQGKDEEIDLEAGSQHILRFKDVKHLIEDNSLSLI